MGKRKLYTKEPAEPVIEVPIPEPPAAPLTADPDNYFTKEAVEELLGKVRKEEKDKLYPQMESLKTRSKEMEDELRRVRESNEAAVAADKAKLDKEAAELEKKRREEADLRTLLEEERQRREQQEQSWQQQLQALKDEQAAKEATLEKERQFLGLLDYRNRRLNEERENDTIDPRLYDYIQGNSEQEIEQAIEMAKAKTQELFEEFAKAQSGRPAPRGVSPVSPITGPSDMIAGGTKRYSPEDIRNMPWSEYEKVRPFLLNVAKPSDRSGLG